MFGCRFWWKIVKFPASSSKVGGELRKQKIITKIQICLKIPHLPHISGRADVGKFLVGAHIIEIAPTIEGKG
jgi:hypothetical protein